MYLTEYVVIKRHKAISTANLLLLFRFGRGLLYGILMIYLFIGVAIASDKFMESIEMITAQGWKFLSSSQCQELGQHVKLLLIGYKRVNNQSIARSAS